MGHTTHHRTARLTFEPRVWVSSLWAVGVGFVKTAAELVDKQLDVIVLSVSILSFEKVAITLNLNT